MKKALATLLIIPLLFALFGCGKGERADVSIFLFPNDGFPIGLAMELEQSLQNRVGDSPTVAIMASPVFNVSKLLVEIAAGDHSIIIISKDQFDILVKQGGMVPLDDLADPDEYPEGVREAPTTGNVGGKDQDEIVYERHLYGIPMSKSPWFREADYDLGDDEIFALIHPRAPKMEDAKLVLAKMLE